MALARSPLAPERFPDMPAVAGVRLATLHSGIRYKNRDDLLLIELAPGSTVAGVLTRSLASSAPVDWCRDNLRAGTARAFVVNAGIANAFTGSAGMEIVRATADAAAAALDCAPEAVFIASTGVIGQIMQREAIARHLPALAAGLKPEGWEAAARAIMTTDTYPKGAARVCEIGGRAVTICGIAKGSGMIAPDMATMLGFVVTDAAIPADVLQALLSEENERTFNRITVDGDTSTSDTLLMAATGAARNEPPASVNDTALAGFRLALHAVLHDLALQVVRDGEGARKFVEIKVAGAESDLAAKRIGLSIANSPLVKTAIAGEDANWGRIVAAIGKAGERADRDRLTVSVGGVLIAAEGMQVPDYDEAPVAAHMKGQEIEIAVDVGIGEGRATVWTCDLTHAYIDINGNYRS
ncbi:MAG TPA: bifunctional glutamate N-acetyltransferase/amino-acid acetyltransferase ArgJ [Alphaproteobacteria bacterium]|nr:bifunctional glutamate N-acetyltransferase/amino-acid acetyltransferase ArgJ [Alphaproteobacteria bacterium]